MRLQKFRRTLLFWSFMLFSFTFVYLSPFMAVMGTVYRTVSGGLLFWGLFGITALILGRSGCGYLCPLGGLQEALHGGMEKPLKKVKYLKILKYVMFAAWIGGIAYAAVVTGGWNKVHVRFMLDSGLPPYDLGAYTALLAFMLFAAIPAMLLGRRGFCHYFCFFAPLNIIGNRIGRLLRIPALRVRVKEKEKCIECRLCDRACPMTLEVTKMVQEGAINHLECISCGNCSAVCRHSAIEYGFKTPQG